MRAVAIAMAIAVVLTLPMPFGWKSNDDTIPGLNGVSLCAVVIVAIVAVAVVVGDSGVVVEMGKKKARTNVDYCELQITVCHTIKLRMIQITNFECFYRISFWMDFV